MPLERDTENEIRSTVGDERELEAHLYGCQALQGVGLSCNCDAPGKVDNVPGDAPCLDCGRDNRHGTHSALEMIGHLSHAYRPEK